MGVDQPGRPDDLLHHLRAHAELVRPRGRGDEHDLGHERVELVERERTVVVRRREPKPEVHEILLARPVPLVHPPHLGHGDVRLVDHDQEVLGEVIEEAPRALAGRAAGEVAGVVLDAGTIPDLAQHLQVVLRSKLEPLRLEQLAVVLEPLDAFPQLLLDPPERRVHLGIRRHPVLGRPDRHRRLLAEDLAGQRVHLEDPLHLVAEELDPDRPVLVGGEDLDDVPPHPEPAPGEVDVVSLVLDIHEPAQDLVARPGFAGFDEEHDVLVVLGGAQAVDARDRRDDDDVPPLHQRLGRGVAQPVDLVVDRGVLGDVEVRDAQGSAGAGIAGARDRVIPTVRVLGYRF